MSASTAPVVEGIASYPSPYGVDETLQRLEQLIRARGLTLFARIDHSTEAQRVGLSMQPAHVLIFGSPKAGTTLMIASPLIALELPLKVLVWQDNGSQVWVSYTETSFLAKRYALPADLGIVIASVEGLVHAAFE